MSEGAMTIYDRDSHVVALQRDVRDLQTEVAGLKATVKGQAEAIRLVLAEALRRMAAELDSGESTVTGPVSSRVTAVWDSWKQKLGGNRAAIIDALLDHGRMNVAQLSVATHTPRRQTIYDSIHSMTKLGLIDKSGDMFSLKQL